MSSLNDVYIKTETLETMVEVLKKRGDNGIAITISINDEANQWGQNISAYVSQSKEEREEKKPRFYVGNGKTYWTDGVIKVAEKRSEIQTAEVVDDGRGDDLPF